MLPKENVLLQAQLLTVGKDGTITELKGGVPIQAQAEKLITQSGGKLLRADPAHLPPNPHTHPHINYITSKGVKGTIKVLTEGFKLIKRY